jgi:hypothetical protein
MGALTEIVSCWQGLLLHLSNSSIKILLINKGQFTLYPRAQYDWINSGGHMYKNTTHQNVLMHYLGFIFFSCTAVTPLTLPPTFWCLGKFHFPLTWRWTIDLLMSYCIIHLSIYLLKKNCWNFNGCNNSHVTSCTQQSDLDSNCHSSNSSS